jgi:threonine/homoserine/homoserine lactone efflux protein
MNLLHGLLLGLGTAVLLGPVFMTLLRNSLQYGVKNGILTAIGIICSDILVVSICYVFAGDFVKYYVNSPGVKLLGALILIGFGISFIRSRKNNIHSSIAEIHFNGKLKSFSQGFLVNFANPTVFVIWIGFVTIAETDYLTLLERIIFLLGILIGIFITDITKTVGAHYISNFLTTYNLNYVYMLLGSCLILLGCYLGFQGLVLL